MINSGLSVIASGLAVIALGTLANCSFNFLSCSVRGRFGPFFSSYESLMESMLNVFW